MSAEHLPCPFCGSQPVRKVDRDILTVSCPNCLSVGFSNHVRFGCMADAQWNERADIVEEKILQHTTQQGQNAQSSTSPVA